MSKTKIFSLVLVPFNIILGYFLYANIKGKIDLDEAIKSSEKRVINKLKLIREAEKAYFSVKLSYTDNWDSLTYFLERDTIYTTQKREIIVQRDADDPLYELGIDSVRIEVDTIGSAIAHEVVFPKEKYPNLNFADLRYVPDPTGQKADVHADKLKEAGKSRPEFEVYAMEFEKNRVIIDVVEVWDPYPLDETRNDDDENPRKWFLRFGSKQNVTLSGNWE